MSNQPKTLPHVFSLAPLRAHFLKTPNPVASNKLIDLPCTDYLDTEEEITVVAAALYVLCVEYDSIEKWEGTLDIEAVRKWIVKRRGEVVKKLAGKIEPPFTAFTVDQMLKDVGAMMEELLVKTIPISPPITPTTAEKGKK